MIVWHDEISTQLTQLKINGKDPRVIQIVFGTDSSNAIPEEIISFK